MNIHPTALIEDGAVIGPDCDIQAYAVIHRHARLGKGVRVFPHAVIGGDPQDLGFESSTPSTAEIGDHAVIREHVTIHRSTKANGATVVGSHAYLMANAHVAHDCGVGDRVIMANAVLLAGHVTVGERSFIGGGAAIHQFVRIGAGVMVGGLSRITRDCPPFTMVAERDELIGFNVVGLRRRGISKATLAELKSCFASIYNQKADPVSNAGQLVQNAPPQSAEARAFVEFFLTGKRGFLRPRRQHNQASD